ncbi:conserved hypothetical protein, secreted [Candidatus Magnetomorum sp. HK-1]|nr:conserved hypothetical protein, secreted [Candidatus Magnetomorum sp. HK-1]
MKKFTNFFILLIFLFICSCNVESSENSWPFSQDKKYKAIKINKDGVHYKIINANDNKEMFTTWARYKDPNDVKSGMFSYLNNSEKTPVFLAAYHYSHIGDVTFIGVWDIPTGKLIRWVKADGYIRNLSWVLDKFKK